MVWEVSDKKSGSAARIRRGGNPLFDPFSKKNKNFVQNGNFLQKSRYIKSRKSNQIKYQKYRKNQEEIKNEKTGLKKEIGTSF